jgi:hypothetical protein
MRRLLVTANVAHSSLILAIMMMEAIHSSKTLVLTRATWHNIPEDGTPQGEPSLPFGLKMVMTSVHPAS